jgi:RimJ/RimL family protein N-acetyltransferase
MAETSETVAIRDTLRGRHVHLRAATLEDIEIFRIWLERIDPQLRAVFPEPLKPLGYWLEEAKSRLGDPNSTTMVIANSSDDGIIGAITYRAHNSLNRSVELEFLADPELRKTELYVEGAKVLITHLFHSLGLNAVYTQSTAADTQTVELVEQLNFTQEGTLRQRHFYNGAFGDVFLYSLLNYERER